MQLKCILDLPPTTPTIHVKFPETKPMFDAVEDTIPNLDDMLAKFPKPATGLPRDGQTFRRRDPWKIKSNTTLTYVGLDKRNFLGDLIKHHSHL
jgi:hypothetical protein